jgi:hypothetical protein
MPAGTAIPARCAATIAAMCVADNGIVTVIGHAPLIRRIRYYIAALQDTRVPVTFKQPPGI